MKNSKTVSKKFPVFEFAIDRKYYPKNQGNLAREYNKKQANILWQLHDLELELVFAELRIRNIFIVIFSKQRKNRPLNMFYIQELNRAISCFNNDYENYCLRLFIYREIIGSFVANFLKLKQEKFWDILDDSKIIELKIDSTLRKFDSGVLKELISYRHKITHKIQFSNEKGRNNGNKKEMLLSDIRKKNKDTKCSLNEILKVKKNVEQRIISQYASRTKRKRQKNKLDSARRANSINKR